MLAAKAVGKLVQTAAKVAKSAKDAKQKAQDLKQKAEKKVKQTVKNVEQKVKNVEQKVKNVEKSIQQNVTGVKDRIKTSIKDGLSNTDIQQIVAKALIDAGMILQKTHATPKKITQQTDTDTTNTDTDAAFGLKKKRKRAIKKTKTKSKSPPLSHFGWKGSLSANQSQNVLKIAVKSLGMKGTINKLMIVQRLHRKNKTGQICAKDIQYLKNNYKK